MLDFIKDKELQSVAIIENNKIKTYQDLNEDIKEIELLLKPRQVVILLCNNSYASILIYLACLRIGSIPLLLSENISEIYLKGYIKRFLPKYIFSPNELKGLTEEYSVNMNYFIYTTNKDNYVNNNNLSLLLTTSGSTGNPKLVKVSYKNLISNTHSICKYLDLKEKERHITILPMNYTFGLSCINTFLYSGGSIILNQDAITSRGFWINLEKHKPTYISGVPYTYEIISKYFLDKLKNSSVRVFTQAGGKLNNKFIEKFIAFSNENKKEFIVMYGQTEATARMSYLPFCKLSEKIGSIGIAIPGGKFSLRNTYKDERKPGGEIGELVYEGDNVTEGYAYNYTDLNKIENVINRLNTGDIGWIDQDNYVYLIGRINRFAKISGIRVSLVDVEELIKNMGYNSAIYSDDIDLKIFIEIEDVIKKDIIKIKNKISNQMNISPNSIKLINIGKLPRLDSGKIDYKELEKRNDS